MAQKSVYIGGLGEDIVKEDLEREFSRFGNLTKVWVAGNPPGFAFIDFQNEEDAKEAIKEMNGAIINRSKIRVNISRIGSKRSRGQSSKAGGFDGGSCDGGSGYYIRPLISQSSHIGWKSGGVLDSPELVKSYEGSSKCKSSGKKRKFSGAENYSSEYAQKRKIYDLSNFKFYKICFDELNVQSELAELSGALKYLWIRLRNPMILC